MTQITQIKWNTDKPKFEDVRGKLLVIKTERQGEFLYPSYQIRSEKTYIHVFTDKNFISYAILTDEPVFCEWEKISEGEHKNYFRSQCQRDLYGVKGANRLWAPILGEELFCPHCSNHIKIIEEVKPMMLDGILPDIQQIPLCDRYQCYWNHHGSWHGTEGNTKQLAITAWNDFVSRMTGEK